MSPWCLTKATEKNVREALRKDGDPQKMIDRGTEGRLTWFAKHVGKENAERLNYLFETKMLLKSQQRGFESFVKYMGGSKEIKRDFLTKVGRIEKALSNTEVEQFLETYVSKRLGVTVTEVEYADITKISDKLKKLKENYDSEKKMWKSEKVADEYGSTQVALNHFIDNLKSQKKTVRQMLKERGYQFKAEVKKKGVISATGKLLLDTASEIAKTSVSLVASVDNSFIGRQGIFTLLTGHPKIWGKTAVKSMGDFVRTVGKGKAEDALMTKVLSDPLYMEGEYQKAGIIDRVEEEYPTTLPSRIPIIGRFFKASDVAFTNSGVRIRTELYKTLRDVKVSRGIEMTTEQIKGLGKVINSVSARGDIGRLNNPITRLVLWAPRMLKADIDIMTAHQFSNIPKADKRIALDNLVKIIIATAIIEAVVTANGEEKTEFDPLSSDFLKLKFGDTRISFLRGISGIIVLTARLLTGKYKSATTGEIKDYGSGFAESSRFDVVVNYFTNKAPPATRSVIDVLRGRDFKGDPPTFSSVLMQAGVPISVQNVLELVANPTTDATFGVVLDFFGFSSNTFRDSNVKTKIIPDEKILKNEDFMSMVQVYAKAMTSDSETAWNRIFTGQRIVQISPGNIIVIERNDDWGKRKKEYAKKYGVSAKDIKEVREEHIIPIAAGGSDVPKNRRMIPKSLHTEFTKVDNAYIRALKARRITQSEGDKIMTEYKTSRIKGSTKITQKDVLEKYK